MREKEYIDQLADAWTMLTSKYSNVVVINTDDQIRRKKLLRYIYTMLMIELKEELRREAINRVKMGKQPEELPKLLQKAYHNRLSNVELEDIVYDRVETLIYDPITGVRRFRLKSERVLDDIPPADHEIISLDGVINHLNMLLSKGKRVVMVFNRIRDVAQQGMFIDDFINYVTSSSAYYKTRSYVFVLTSMPRAIFKHDTLNKVIYLDPPYSTASERRGFIKSELRYFGIDVDENTVERAVQVTSGLPLEKIEGIVRYSIREGKLDIETMRRMKYMVLNNYEILSVFEPKYGFEAVGGYQYVKDVLTTYIINPIKYPSLSTKIGVKPIKGILLYGPPGTGKTHLAKALAKETGLPFVTTKASQLYSKYYGETSQRFETLIKVCEEIGPVILFIDEIDQLGRRGHATEHEESRRAFSILLSWLGDPDRKTIVIGTTNRPQDLDEAFIRSGRLDLKIPIFYPTYEARLEILKIHSKLMNLNLAEDVDLSHIARETVFWQGADLVDLLKRAAAYALRDSISNGKAVIRQSHLLEALERSNIEREERRRKMSEWLKLAEKYTNDRKVLEEIKEIYHEEAPSEEVDLGGGFKVEFQKRYGIR